MLYRNICVTATQDGPQTALHTAVTRKSRCFLRDLITRVSHL